MMEVLIVIVLISVLAGLAIPSLNQTYYKILLDQSTNDLAYLMRYAQSRAIIQQRIVQWSFYSSRRSYSLQQESPQVSDDVSGEKKFSLIHGRLGRMFKIPNELNLTAKSPSIQFYPDGKIDKANFLLCRKDRCLTISTKEQTGHVLVWENP